MRALLFTLAVLIATPAAAQVGTLEPVDEAAEDPSFILFRARLLEAAQARDTSFVLSVLDPHATLSFGGDAGPEGFRTLWLTEPRPEGDDVWTVLTQAVALGSTYDADATAGTARATVPYVYGAWPDSLDAYEHMAVIGENVHVRAEPSTGADIISALSYAVVPTPYDDDPPEGWRRVILDDGRMGYVADRYLRSPIDHRIGFVKRDGGWRITFFVAGD